ncbi:abc transporter [Ophiostoma piceae UAMH 11346]|uniref:Abc transporter n=1 Tax=Ophiostoma piceae (strain UAMH 11346) TaxID=1262450 RepID=S3DA63_OPHP1|nr:abc transporter [Ophiostoma piceae UAMH 11346]
MFATSSQDTVALASGTASALLVAAAPWQPWQRRRASVKVKPSRLAVYKICASAVYVLGRMALLGFAVAASSTSTTARWSGYLGLAAAVVASAVSFHDHRLSVRPSSILVLYLTVSLALDIVSLASPLQPRWQPFYLYMAMCFQALAKLVLLLLECKSKSGILQDEYRSLPPEDLANILSLTYFWWLHDLLELGFSKILSPDDLPRIDTQLNAERLRQKIIAAWGQRDGQAAEQPMTLPKVLFRCFVAPLSLAIPPRLGVVFFQFSQPLLISRAITFVQRPQETDADDASAGGFWIVVSAVVIYFGLTTSTAIYRHRLNRLNVMFKGALVGLVHQKVLTGRSHGYDDGKALTLISTDVSSVEGASEMLHELWGFFLEGVVGFSLLASEIGWLWPLPVGIVLLFSQTSRHTVKPMKSRQTVWNDATQQRLSMTSSIIGAIKSVKMLGIQSAAERLILLLRARELKAANGVRWVNVAYNSSANALGLFSPVLTVAIFSVWTSAHGREFDTRTAFTTIAILSMITHPINMIMTLLPRATASLSSFERIQAFLLKHDVDDARHLAGPEAIKFKNATITGRKSTRNALQIEELALQKESFNIIAGPVGSGKSLMLHAALGEVPLSTGSICVSSKNISFCSQTAWLPNRTVRECIVGIDSTLAVDHYWYETVLSACCLHEDMRELADGHDTVVGTNGQNLSGGQRQRVAIARAVYARNEIAIFDDSFSALDAKTQKMVVNNLFGLAGLLRRARTTVLWAVSSSLYIHLSDAVVILEEGRVQYHGSKDALNQLIEVEAIAINSGEHDNTDGHTPQLGASINTDPKPATVTIPNYHRKDGDLSLYKYYIASAGLGNVLLLIFLAMLYAFFFTIPPYYLKWWTESATTHTILYAVGYVSLLLVAWIATSITKWTDLVIIAGKSGEVLHQRLLHAICNAPITFFSTTDLGTVLNRFTQDIQLVDKQISQAMSYLMAQVFKLLMQTIVLITTQPRLSLFLPVCTAVVYVIQKWYLRTSRQLRRMELESQSAVYFNILETVGGLSTIRAFGWQEAIARENAVCLDNSQRPIYLLLCLQRWLNVVLDAIVACVAVGTVWLAISASQTNSNGGQVGVALNVILVTNTTLLRLVQSWTNLEVSLGAVARLREASHETPQEETGGGAEALLPSSWPSAGHLQLTNMAASYTSNTPVLKGVSLDIWPGQVAVICGRTASGKSSLLMSLLRLLTVSDGNVCVDSIDLAGLPLKDVRQRAFVTISQDAFLLPAASLRFHLDPTESLSSDVLEAALKKTGVLDIFASSSYDSTTSSLWDRPLSSFPVLSAGQAQLLSLTRALLQLQTRSEPIGTVQSIGDPQGLQMRRPIILLDEITASLDAETEAMVYDVVEDVFIKSGHTVLVVTHRPAALASRLRAGDVTVQMASGGVDSVTVFQ